MVGALHRALESASPPPQSLLRTASRVVQAAVSCHVAEGAGRVGVMPIAFQGDACTQCAPMRPTQQGVRKADLRAGAMHRLPLFLTLVQHLMVLREDWRNMSHTRHLVLACTHVLLLPRVTTCLRHHLPRTPVPLRHMQLSEGGQEAQRAQTGPTRVPGHGSAREDPWADQASSQAGVRTSLNAKLFYNKLHRTKLCLSS